MVCCPRAARLGTFFRYGRRFQKLFVFLHRFKRIIGDKADLYRDMCEEIILWITIISDKKDLVKIIKDKYGTVFER